MRKSLITLLLGIMLFSSITLAEAEEVVNAAYFTNCKIDFEWIETTDDRNPCCGSDNILSPAIQIREAGGYRVENIDFAKHSVQLKIITLVSEIDSSPAGDDQSWQERIVEIDCADGPTSSQEILLVHKLCEEAERRESCDGIPTRTFTHLVKVTAIDANTLED